MRNSIIYPCNIYDYAEYIYAYRSRKFNRPRNNPVDDKPTIIPPDTKLIEADEVIGSSSILLSVNFEIPFPENYPLTDLVNNSSEIKELTCITGTDTIIVSGMVHKNLQYKCFEGIGTFQHNKSQLNYNFGTIRYITACIPFSCIIDIQGVTPGDSCEIEAFAEDSFCRLAEKLSDDCENSESFTGESQDMHFYIGVKEQIVIRINVKVLRQTCLIFESIAADE